MKVATLMTTDPTVVTADITVEHALELMDDGDFRHLPVVEGETLVGVLSERDVLEALGQLSGGDGTSEDVLASNRPRLVREIMQSEVHTVTPEDSVDAAASVLSARRIGALPVVRDRLLVGIVTEMDLLAAFERLCAGQGLPDSSNPPVAECMTATIHAVQRSTSLQEACATCFNLRVRHLPVIDGGVLVGIVSDRDLRAASSSAHPLAIRVSDIMATEVETTVPEARLAEAAQRMVDLKITTLPVMDGTQIVGMLSLTDVLDHCSRVLGAV